MQNQQRGTRTQQHSSSQALTDFVKERVWAWFKVRGPKVTLCRAKLPATFAASPSEIVTCAESPAVLYLAKCYPALNHAEVYEEGSSRGALRSGADLPPQQLLRDAERITSRRRLFLGTFPQGSPPFDAALGLFSRRARAALTCPKNGPLPPHHAAFRAKTLPRGVSLPRPRVSVPRGYLRHLAGHSQGKPTGVRKTLLATARPATPKGRRADGDHFDDRLFSIRRAIGRPARPRSVICSADHDGRQTTC
jgi:hypothetical protein